LLRPPASICRICSSRAEAVAGGGFWSPVVHIGATVLRSLQALRPPVGFHAWGVVLGLMGHMMTSVILAGIFTPLVARRVASRGSLAVAGAAYGLVVFFVMWYLVIPAVDPIMLNLTAAIFALAHLAWGVTLGLFLPAQAEAMPRASAA